jgi:WD40 repeat protein
MNFKHFIAMKNSTHRMLQAVKWSCLLGVILLAVSLSQTAYAQVPVFFDTGFNSNHPPTPGPNDIYQTNALFEVYSSSGMTYSTDQSPPPGVTFVTPPSGTLYAVTNVMIGTSGLASDYGTSGAGNGTPTNDNQSYVLSFYQIAGTSAANGISTSATLIASVVSSNGLVRTPGDWMSFSNFAVFLAPGTTNAFALSRLSYNTGNNNGSGLTRFEGEGWMHLMVVTNNIGGTGATHYFGTGAGGSGTNNFYNGMTCMITNTSAISYGVGSTINNNVPRTNASTVFDVGISTSFLPAVFLAQPQSYQIANSCVATATLVATGAGSSNSAYGIGGYWVLTNTANPSGRVLASGYRANGLSLGSTNITTTITPSPIGAAGATVTSTLTVSNYRSADVGSYVFIITNSANGTTVLSSASAVATLSFVGVQPNSFAATVISNGYGAIAYYPLNETVDPSTGIAVAYELIGGANGIYAPAANNGAGNSAESGVGQTGWGPVPGPGSGAAPLSGLPAQGALGSLENSFVDDYVVVPNGPTNTASATGIANSTNVTFVAWVYDNTFTETGQAGIVSYRSSVTGTGADALCGANSQNNALGWVWDNNNSSTYNYAGGPALSSNVWSMAALVVTPANTVFYFCNTNVGIVSVTQTIANQWQPLGGRMCIGAEEYHPYAWPGYISSVAIFTNSLSALQIEALYLAGETQDKPMVLSQPASAAVYPGGSAVFTVSALDPNTMYYQWEAGAVGSGVYTNISNGGVFSGANGPTLTITDPSQCNIADYVVVITDSAGQTVASYPATMSLLNWEQPGQGGIVTAVATSPDGDWIASGSDDGTVKLWRTSDYGFECTLGASGLFPVSALAFGPVGSNTVAVGYYDGSMRLWNTANGALIRTFNLSWATHTNYLAKVSSLAYSPNGQQLATGNGDMFTRIWSASTGALLNSWSKINGEVRGTAYSPDGTLLAIGGEATNLIKSIVVLHTADWSTATNLYVGSNSVAQGSNNVTSLTFSPDGTMLASGCLDQTICVWNTSSWALQSAMTNNGLGITALAFTPNSQTLFAGDLGGNITPWSPSLGKSNAGWPAHTGQVWSLACTVDGTKLVSGGDDHLARVWQTANGAWVTNLNSHTTDISRTCFAPDGSLIATVGNDASLRLWKASTGAPAYALAPHTNQISALAFSPDATFLVSGGGCMDNQICLWNPTNGAWLQTIPSLFTNGVTALAVSPDTTLIASAGDRYEQVIKVWNRSGGTLAGTLAGHTNGTSVLAFSPNGRYLASGGMFYSGSIKLWDMSNNGNLAYTFNGHTCAVVSISFNPTGTLLASVGQNDGQICVWTNGATTPIWSNVMSAEARAVAFSPDGTLLAAAGSDIIQMWRTSNWTPVWTCTAETVGINSMSFSPNGTFLTYGRDDGTVCQMWNPQAAPVQLWLGATQAGRFTIANPSYSPFLSVQSSSNLSQWSPLTNLVAGTNVVQFADPSPAPKERFYRVTTPQ